MPDQGTLARHKNENWKQWQARRLACERLPKAPPAQTPSIETPGLTVSGRPFNEPQTPPPPSEVPGRENIEGVYVGQAAFNPRVIFIGIRGRHDPIAVHVRDRTNFVRGMTVRAYRDTTPSTAPVWFLDGPLPRFRGRY